MRFLTLVFLGLISLTSLTMSSDAEAYWHGYRGGWHGGWAGGWHGGYGWRGGPGCWRCGGGWGPGPVIAAGVVGATAVGVAAAEAAPPAYLQQAAPVVVESAPISTSSIPPIGSKFPALLPGCALAPRNGINFYQCEGFRMRPLYGGNNLYYRVVPG